MDRETFYREVGLLLGVEHTDYVQHPGHSKRWGPREPGNGRYPGSGTVRVYADDLIQVNPHTPVLTGTFRSYEAAISALQAVLV